MSLQSGEGGSSGCGWLCISAACKLLHVLELRIRIVC